MSDSDDNDEDDYDCDYDSVVVVASSQVRGSPLQWWRGAAALFATPPRDFLGVLCSQWAA